MVNGIQGGNSILRSLKWYKQLEHSSVRAQEGFFIAEGTRAVEQIMRSAPDTVDEVLVSEEYRLDSLYADKNVRVISSSQMDAVSAQKTSQGIIAVVKISNNSFSDFVPDNPGNRILLLEHIQDPGNVGTLLRTAAAFDFSGVILSTISADPFSQKVIQASAGSLLSLWIRRTSQYIKIVKKLQNAKYKLVAMCVDGSEESVSGSEKIIVALGNEGNGLSSEVEAIADVRCRIPINDKKVESLNVAITGALVMYSAVSGK
ncbi:MAG TPA: RNA methyltransferase [Chitinispirillaceae bacterium]|nr:RNA methyltransferase [Chitinispirillaceae bacterium]